MTTYLVSRHAGAIEWMRAEMKVGEAIVLPHLSAEVQFQRGDVVAGVIPLRWAAAVHLAGATCWSLEFDAPAGSRGVELTAKELTQLRARLEKYIVIRR